MFDFFSSELESFSISKTWREGLDLLKDRGIMMNHIYCMKNEMKVEKRFLLVFKNIIIKLRKKKEVEIYYSADTTRVNI